MKIALVIAFQARAFLRGWFRTREAGEESRATMRALLADDDKLWMRCITATISEILREHVKDGCIDLVYLDPPFNSNASSGIRRPALLDILAVCPVILDSDSLVSQQSP